MTGKANGMACIMGGVMGHADMGKAHHENERSANEQANETCLNALRN